jgi:ribosomal protein L37E
MFFTKAKSIACAVCGKPIAPKARRFVDKNRVTKEERHTHITCGSASAVKRTT